MGIGRKSSISLLCRLLQPRFVYRPTSTTASRGLESVPLHIDDALSLKREIEAKNEQTGFELPSESIKWKDDLPGSTRLQLDTAPSVNELPTQPELQTVPLHSFSGRVREQSEAISSLLGSYRVLTMFPVSQPVFRELLRHEEQPKKIRRLLSAQLLHCHWPRHILRIMAVALQKHEVAKQLAMSTDPMMRAMYRCRNNVSDPEVMSLLSMIIIRFRQSNIKVDPMLIFMALKFAARSRSLPGMKKFLRIVRQDGLIMSPSTFREVIAKFSIGSRGFGEIRNGRWKRRDLLQVLKGFEDTKDLPAEEQYHLGSFLIRHDWHYLHGWIAVLARCKDSDAIWQEWELWKRSDQRINPQARTPQNVRRGSNTRDRGDVLFVEQMTYSGDISRAWQMLQEIEVEFGALKSWVKDRLLENTEHVTIPHQQLQEELLEKHERDRLKICENWNHSDHGFPYADAETEYPLNDARANAVTVDDRPR